MKIPAKSERKAFSISSGFLVIGALVLLWIVGAIIAYAIYPVVHGLSKRTRLSHELAAVIEARLSESRHVLELALDPADGAGVSWLHRHTEVMSKAMREDGRLAMTVRTDPANAERARAKFSLAGHAPQ